ncbi:DUF1345 domain-containing protein [Sphingomonas sp. KRR8]|uniref:DUF1345 domain-containing protein n=1 Tax=Sphingomonas sp. KRR8 TaxID=2942996 RepID=UPI00201FC223|nr:DUF1345 domain-containing protein [Sphingomonas sp. KRR8]URD60111.1 DUF1345 domain-containing protein [Sphingomonas sp. KRR8]
MAEQRGIGNVLAPPRYLAFLATLLIVSPIAAHVMGRWGLGVLIGFDIAAMLFLLLVLPLLGTREARIIREAAASNDANRTLLLALTGIVMIVLLTAITAETMGGHNPEPFTKAVVILTLALAWLFSNTVYALHYAHMVYRRGNKHCHGLQFPGTEVPVYWDFVYFSFTCGMAFATSDVVIADQAIRRVVTLHSLAAFAFNIGVLAFTINVLGSGG